MLPPLEKTRRLEERLAAVPYERTLGGEAKWSENNNKWAITLKPFLVDEQTALSITGGVAQCSESCLNEGGDRNY